MFIICAKKTPTLRESIGYSLFAKHFGSEAFGEKLLESHLLIVTYRACDYNYHFVGVAEFTHHLSADAAWGAVIARGEIFAADYRDSFYPSLSSGSSV